VVVGYIRSVVQRTLCALNVHGGQTTIYGSVMDAGVSWSCVM
jgi:hypothetical protein